MMEEYLSLVITLSVSWSVHVQNSVSGAGFCNSNPCQNSGVCEPRGNQGYMCKCPDAYSGVNCETLNECGSNPCQNGGDCVDGLGRYVCKCKLGFTGISCQTDIDECAQSPCQNGGICEDLLDGFKCHCSPDYLGTRCEVYNEAYGRRSGLVWTIVAVSVIVILVFVILAISLSLTVRRKRTLERDSDTTTENVEYNMASKKKRGGIFNIPRIFKKKAWNTKRPINFTVMRSPSIEMTIERHLSLGDLRQVDEVSHTQESYDNMRNDRSDAHRNWFLTQAIINEGRTLSSNIYSGQSHLTPFRAVVPGNISLVGNAFPTTGAGPHVTHLHVNE